MIFGIVLPHFRIKSGTGKEGLGAGNLKEESLAADGGGQNLKNE